MIAPPTPRRCPAWEWFICIVLHGMNASRPLNVRDRQDIRLEKADQVRLSVREKAGQSFMVEPSAGEPDEGNGHGSLMRCL